jgi:hypothetical protein
MENMSAKSKAITCGRSVLDVSEGRNYICSFSCYEL